MMYRSLYTGLINDTASSAVGGSSSHGTDSQPRTRPPPPTAPPRSGGSACVSQPPRGPPDTPSTASRPSTITDATEPAASKVIAPAVALQPGLGIQAIA